MLYRIEADNIEALSDIMQTLNTTKQGFLMYWYQFDYYKKGEYENLQQYSGYYVDLNNDNRDLAEMAEALSSYDVKVLKGFKDTHDNYRLPSAEDKEYFDAIPLYISKSEEEIIKQ